MTVISLPAIGATLLPFVGGIPLRILARQDIAGWYSALKKPEWTPPSSTFGGTWCCLYAGMGYASHLVYQSKGESKGVALALYASQLALNWSWISVFFAFHQLKTSCYLQAALWSNVVACGISFYKVNRTAGHLMLPYAGWVTLTALLNYAIWKDNTEDAPEEDDEKIPEKKD